MNFDGSKYKAGDTVIVHRDWNASEVATIDRKTPSGFIVIGRQTFNGNGRLRGATRHFSAWLADPDPETVELIARRKLVASIDSRVFGRNKGSQLSGWADLSTDQLQQIAELLRVRPEAKGGE